MKKTFFHHISNTHIPLMVCSILLVSCSPSVSEIQLGNTPSQSAATTIVEVPLETSRPSATLQPSYLVFDHITGDAGNYYVLAGETITITWENAPVGADQYEFRIMPENGESPLVLENDIDAADGVSVSWTIPEQLAAELQATAIFPDGKKVELPYPPMLYSGDLPPPGVCSLLARNQPVEVYRLPDRSAEIFALLRPAVYAHVLEIAPDGWYRIDASVAEIYTPSQGSLPDINFQDFTISLSNRSDHSPASGDGWVNGDKGILLIGDCSSEEQIITYYFIDVEDFPYPEGSVVVMEDTYILAPMRSEFISSNDIAADLRQALLFVLKDSRNDWNSSELEIADVTFEDGHAGVILQGEYFGVGDITLITARMQILLTVFANPAVQTATVTLNGDTIGNLGVSNSMWARPANYVFPRSEIENYLSENAYQSP